MRLSVIIPCLNAAGTIGTQLDALAQQHWSEPWEVIVADNGSSDASPAVVSRWREQIPGLRIVHAAERRGAAHARNAGAAAAEGEALVFCDADDQVAPGWLTAVGQALSKYDFVASRFDFEKLNPQAQRKTNNPQRYRLQEMRYPPYLPFAGACGLGVKRAVHQSVGGFDESLLALEDVDYCVRVQRAGVKLHFAPDATMYIRQRDEIRDLYRQARLWAEYNVLIYKRHRGPAMRIPQAWPRHLINWVYLMRTLPRFLRGENRGAWVWHLGWQTGLLRGSIKYWVSPPPA